eukprot:3098714-Rhodomonas_salina.8
MRPLRRSVAPETVYDCDEASDHVCASVATVAPGLSSPGLDHRHPDHQLRPSVLHPLPRRDFQDRRPRGTAS